MPVKLRMLKHDDPLECNHGGVVTLGRQGPDVRLDRDLVLTDKDLLERATIACKGKKPCTRVIAIVQGLSTEVFVRGGEIPILSNLSALTNGGPPGEVTFDASKALRALLKAFLISIEGPPSNDPHDPGGETRKGITWSTWKSLGPKLGIPADHDRFVQMSDEDWDKIYNHGFYDAVRADDIDHPGVAAMLVDFHFNSGTNADKAVQNILINDYGQPISATGTVDQQTVDAINSVDGDALLGDLIEDRYAFLQRFIDKHPYYAGKHGRESGLHARVRKLSEIIQRFVYGAPASTFCDPPDAREDQASRIA